MACLLCLGFSQIGHGACLPAKAWFAQELMQCAWQRANDEHNGPATWPWSDTWPVARLSAKSGEIDLIVLAGGSERTLEFGPGHLSASAMPGESGNVVIAGHRDTHFRFLQHLDVGESLIIETMVGRKHIYKVISIDVVDSRRGSLLLDTDDPTLSLVTSYPFDARTAGGPMRYVVTAKMIH